MYESKCAMWCVCRIRCMFVWSVRVWVHCAMCNVDEVILLLLLLCILYARTMDVCMFLPHFSHLFVLNVSPCQHFLAVWVSPHVCVCAVCRTIWNSLKVYASHVFQLHGWSFWIFFSSILFFFLFLFVSLDPWLWLRSTRLDRHRISYDWFEWRRDERCERCWTLCIDFLGFIASTMMDMMPIKVRLRYLTCLISVISIKKFEMTTSSSVCTI